MLEQRLRLTWMPYLSMQHKASYQVWSFRSAQAYAEPKEYHLQAMKHVFHYSHGTKHYGLKLFMGVDLQLHAYSDLDWVGDYNTWHSTSEKCFFSGGACIYFLSKKQPIMTIVNCRVEHRVAFTANIECVWFIHLLGDQSPPKQSIKTYYLCTIQKPFLVKSDETLIEPNE